MKLHTPAARRSLAILGAVVIAAGPLAACGDDSDEKGSDTTTTEAAAASLEITDVWARPGMAGGNSAIYMVVTAGKDADSLTAAEVPTDIAAETQVHETVMADDSAGSTTMAGDMETTTTMGGDMGTSSTMGGDMGGSDMMTMKEVDKVDIPADGSVEFKPGGYHVMLLDLKKDLVAGDTIEVTLTFEKAGKKTATATVKDV